jgi:crossover junction endodeoxyribonuclease RusA
MRWTKKQYEQYVQKRGSKNIYTPTREPIRIIIPGRPVPKQRPRFARTGHIYTPQETRDYEDFVGWKAKEVVKEPLEGDIALYIRVYVNRNVFADIDNIAKAIMDGLNGVAYKDDRQVVCLSIQRIKGREERVEIELEEVS